MAPAAKASDSVGVAERAGRSALAARVPAIKTTGNYELDSEAESLREMKMDIIDAIVQSDAHVLALHGVLAKRLRNQGVPKRDDFFDDISVVGRLPDDWMGGWISQVSDLGASDILRIRQFDNEAVLQLFVFATQLPPRLKLPDACRSKRLMVAPANSRHDAYMKRLSTFKAGGGVLPSGQLNFLNKIYRMTWENNRLTSIQYGADGTALTIPSHVHIMRDFEFEMGYLDGEARVVKRPMPAMKLITFWDKRSGPGPHTHDIITGGNNKRIATLVAELDAQIQEADRQRTAGMYHNDIKNQLDEQKSEQRKASMKRAQQAAMVSLAAKRTKRTLSLGGTQATSSA